MRLAVNFDHLIVASNRLPVTIERGRRGPQLRRSSGGLVAALDPALRTLGGSWLGWLGAPGSAPDTDLGYALEPIELTSNEVRRYYQGFANRTLWPLFHSFPERVRVDPRDFAAYDAINRRFAERIARRLGPRDLVWIHDYHLLRCALHLREVRPEARIALFVHIPFPPYDVYRVLPQYREALLGMLACDLIGFHCPGYVANFLDCVERLLGERIDRDAERIEHGSRTVQVGAFPLGIDYAAFEKRARDAPPSEESAERIILGVDRLDYTKGIPQRLLAFEHLLEHHREHRGRVVFLQVAVPSRTQVSDYHRLKRQIDELVGRVNGRFGGPRWTPIHYLHRSLDPARLAALYRDAEVALVTPLRDGMNLVAKEFVACQVAEPGVLVLSQMTGAAETMEEALRVNPYNLDGVAETLHRALTLPAEDRLARMRALQKRERDQDVLAWCAKFLEAAGTPASTLAPVGAGDFERWIGRQTRGWPLVVFLDYDGTLAEIARRPSEAQLSASMREALAACAARGDTDLVIVSGRALADVRAMVGVPQLVYAGNHGLEIEGPGMNPFRHPDLAHYAERAGRLAPELAALCDDGAWVEEKGATLTLHYRELAHERQPPLVEAARARISAAGFQARDARCALEARPPIAWDKGHAALHVLRDWHGQAWSTHLRVIYAGDDDTDEDAFRALQGLGVTFRVGAADQPTSAQRRLRDVSAVEAMLRWLAARP
ncbi:MAG: bifunctional alpha,alpha-trehalose-phosphate synthase (UDP-forming)/trehalose-phosphatase [Deltaproteobacteria bacterium]|nr:MAG: bifunctional alpha,alpha-trehalose-phosphate synthase (UDP-forming)/trehalose-phosphatase [Deltaproteobacteria bacterium]